MYNRYIPQPDGSYQRNRINDPPGEKPEKHPESPPCDPAHFRQPERNEYTGVHGSIPGFLKRLLPANLDTGDLLIILLLLLMAGDKEESKQTALLTLALYFFM